jgi:hypothetical protein
MNIDQINHAIKHNGFTNDELSSIIDTIKYARAQLTQRTRRACRLGDTVKFTSNKNGNTYQGLVTKIAIKYITVKTPAGLQWRVPANMLEFV